MEKIQILIVDDEPDIRDVLRLLLETRGYVVHEAADGQSAISFMRAHGDIDLVIIDVMMPGMNGYETCAGIRQFSNAPALFLTARSGEDDRLSAYHSGGDDFLAKPFSQAVLLAKVSALLRRYTEYKGKPEAGLTVSSISIDLQKHKAFKDGVQLELTDKELSILEYLVTNRGAIVSAQSLYENVWQEKYMPSSTNTVMVHILNLRKKIEDDASNPKIIRTIWGKGYQID